MMSFMSVRFKEPMNFRGLESIAFGSARRSPPRAARGGLPGGVAVIFLSILLIAAVSTIAGCEAMGYYSQAIGGQLSLLARRQPVERLLDEGNPDLRADLERSQRILDFAEVELLLSADGAYRSYVALSSENVVWNLYAAPPLSLEARRWCYPVMLYIYVKFCLCFLVIIF